MIDSRLSLSGPDCAGRLQRRFAQTVPQKASGRQESILCSVENRVHAGTARTSGAGREMFLTCPLIDQGISHVSQAKTVLLQGRSALWGFINNLTRCKLWNDLDIHDAALS
jgi:hypothetical protein